MEKVRKKSFYILASNLLGFPVQLLRSIILANVLGPTGFGILSFSLFFQIYQNMQTLVLSLLLNGDTPNKI